MPYRAYAYSFVGMNFAMGVTDGRYNHAHLTSYAQSILQSPVFLFIYTMKLKCRGEQMPWTKSQRSKRVKISTQSFR